MSISYTRLLTNTFKIAFACIAKADAHAHSVHGVHVVLVVVQLCKTPILHHDGPQHQHQGNLGNLSTAKTLDVVLLNDPGQGTLWQVLLGTPRGVCKDMTNEHTKHC